MNKKKFLSKIIVASMATGTLLITPAILNLDTENLAIVSVAHAEISNYTAEDTAMFDFGENDESIVNKVKNMARKRAEKAAKEKAGVYLSGYSQIVKGNLTKSEITAVTNDISEVLDVVYERFFFQALDANEKPYGKVGIMYKAKVTVKIDTDGISNYLNRDAQEKAKIVQQVQNTQAAFAEANNKFEELRATAAKKTPKQIKFELQQIEEEILSEEKMTEGNKLAYRGDYQGALSKYNEAVQIDPNNAHARKNVSTIYSYWKNEEQAKADYDKAIQDNPRNSDAYRNRGMFYFYLNDYEKAIQDFNKAIELNPNNARHYFDRGYIYYYYKENNEQALRDFSRAIELNPKEAVFYMYRANTYEAMGQVEKARADSAKADELNNKK